MNSKEEKIVKIKTKKQNSIYKTQKEPKIKINSSDPNKIR